MRPDVSCCPILILGFSHSRYNCPHSSVLPIAIAPLHVFIDIQKTRGAGMGIGTHGIGIGTYTVTTSVLYPAISLRISQLCHPDRGKVGVGLWGTQLPEGAKTPVVNYILLRVPWH